MDDAKLLKKKRKLSDSLLSAGRPSETTPTTSAPTAPSNGWAAEVSALTSSISPSTTCAPMATAPEKDAGTATSCTNRRLFVLKSKNTELGEAQKILRDLMSLISSETRGYPKPTE